MLGWSKCPFFTNSRSTNQPASQPATKQAPALAQPNVPHLTLAVWAPDMGYETLLAACAPTRADARRRAVDAIFMID